MTSTTIEIRAVTDQGAVVRLPPVFWLMREFKAAFRKARPASRVWTFFVLGKTAVRRVGIWAAVVEARVIAEIRRRERARADAEWEAAGASA